MENLPLGIKDVNIRKVSYGNGSTTAPTMTFLEDQQIGIYSTGSGVGFTVGGNTVVTVDSNNIGYNLTQTINNSATPPSVPTATTFGYLFKKPGDGGLYWSSQGAGEIDLTSQANGMPQVTFDAAFSAKTTDDLTEGATNLYMTSSRFTTQFNAKTTTNLTEGTNLYYTDGRADSRVSTGFSTRTTTNLAEGINLYYTNTRADARFDTKWALKTTDDLTQGSTNLYLTTTQSNNITANTNTIANYLNQNVKTTASPEFISLTLTGDLSSYNIIPASNTKTVGNALNYFGAGYMTSIYGTLQTASQPNITGLGTLSSTLNMAANIIPTITITNDLGSSLKYFASAYINSINCNSITMATSEGILHSNSSGAISSSLIVNTDVSASAAIVDTKLATISTSGKVSNTATTATSANTASAIVARDASFNFSAGTITASLTGAASLNLLKAGDTMTGNLTMSGSNIVLDYRNSNILKLAANAGTEHIKYSVAADGPEICGTTGGCLVSSSNSGTYPLLWTATGIDVMAITTRGGIEPYMTLTGDVGSASKYFSSIYGSNVNCNNITMGTLTSAGVLHNSITGAFSSSLIVAADITNGTITNAKLATVSSANTASYIVARDAGNNFSAGTITASLTGAASLNLLLTGGTLSGGLNMGTNAITGISGITAPVFSTAGIIHNNSSGVFSSSLIVNADITDATITNAKLATVTSANTASAIVARDASFNFSAGTITASLTGAASLNLLLTGGTLSGDLNMTAHILPSTTNLYNLGNTLLYFDNGYINNVITNGITIAGFSTAGIIHNNSSGVFSSSLIVNADITDATITDAKLATISTSGKVSNNATTATDANTASAIVARDASFNFSAGTITANLSGNVTGNLSGNLSITTSCRSIVPVTNDAFPLGGSSARFSSVWASAGNFASSITVPAMTTAGIIHNTALTGLFTSSLIVDADITDATITNAKLATVTSANTASAIVARDANFSFSAGTITASLTGAASLNLLLTGGTLSGGLNMGTNAITGISGITAPVFSTAGIIHNNSSGVFSSSLIVNADVSASAAIADTKLATISTAGKVSNSATTATDANTASAIVARDASNNFSAGTITAAVTLNDGTLTLRTPGDANHLLKFVTAVDGPELRGNGGGILTTNSGGNATKLSWNTSGVNIAGILTSTHSTNNQITMNSSSSTGLCNILFARNGVSSEFGMRADADDNDIYLFHRNAFVFRTDTSAGKLRVNTTYPLANNTYDLGLTGIRFKDIFVINAVTVGSSRTLKENITGSDLGEAFINSLNPVKYKFRDYTSNIVDADGTEKTVSYTHHRTHYGLIAEEVRDAVLATGKTTEEYAVYVEGDSTEFGAVNGKISMLRYEELLSPLIKAFQELSAKVAAIEAKLIANNIV